MSLQLILGSSGAGKSHTLYKQIIQESIENPRENYIVIVPEQFTMQTQKDLVTLHPDHGVMNIDILSFLRLAYRVFEETNTTKQLVLEDTGKTMVLRKVIEEKKDELLLFQNNVHKQGFVSELKSFLSELYQYSIGPEQLKSIIGEVKNRPMLSGKLQDMLVIYEGFQQFIHEKYITAEEIIDRLCEVIEDSRYIKNCVVCLDGFTGFTPIQNRLVQKLMKLCKKVIVTVTIDDRESIIQRDEAFKLFHLSKETIHTLFQLAKDAHIPVEDPYYVRKGKVPYRFRESTALAFLEHNLFRYPFRQYKEKQQDIRILVGKDAMEEIRFTICEIRRLIQEEGYRYKDIAVVTGDLVTYGTKIQKEYDKAKIPCFIDLKKEIISNPLVELVQAVLDLVSKDFAYEPVLHFLRNGLIEMNKEEIDELENYILAVGIRGYKAWKEPFTRIYKTKGELNLDKLNELRLRVIQIVEPVRIALKEKEGNIADYTTALYEFLVTNRVEEKMVGYCQFFETSSKPLLAKEYKQVYGLVMELFDKLVELLGDEVVSVKEYKELLASGFQEARVGVIPPGIDQIVVGDIERTRLKDIKAVFFIGVNDGIIPKGGNQGGIISDVERELLVEHEVIMAPTNRQNAYTEQFYLYLNLTKPTNRLYLTYSKVSCAGKSMRPSYVISKMMQLFPSLESEDLEYIQEGERLSDFVGCDQGLHSLITGLRLYREYGKVDSALWQELYSWYCKQEEKKELVDLLVEGAFYENKELEISRAVAEALYGTDLKNSVTRLEKYAACAYAHFLSYGLELTERKQFQLSMPDMGTIFHEAMELFAKKLHASEYDWSTITEEARNAIVIEAVEEAAISYNNTIFLSSKRNEYMIKRVERITKRTVWALCEHVKSGDFVPQGFELQFSRLDHLESVHVPLNHNRSMHLQGRIDRVDVAEEDENVYLRVVDYKSGTTNLDMNKLYYGLQLQLVVYLNAAMELQQQQNPKKLIIPAGIFYYNIDDPVVGKEKSIEKIEANLLKELKMNGFVNKEEDVLKAMDHKFIDDENKDALKGSVKSSVIPVETTKDGSISKRSSAASRAQFASMTNYVMGKVKQFGNEIVDGTTCMNPYQMGERTACDYCEYYGVCGFDQKLPGNTFRRLTEYDDKKIWEEMRASSYEDEEQEEGKGNE